MSIVAVQLVGALAVVIGLGLWAVGYLLLAGERDGRRQQCDLAALRVERVRARMEIEHHVTDLFHLAAARELDAQYANTHPRPVRPRRGAWFQPVPHR